MQARVVISDFAVFSAIILMVLVDFIVGLGTPKLEVPPDFRVSIGFANRLHHLLVNVLLLVVVVCHCHCHCQCQSWINVLQNHEHLYSAECY